MNAKIIFISMFAAVMVIFLFLLNCPRIPSAFVCTAKSHVFLHTQKEGVSIEGEVLLGKVRISRSFLPKLTR